MADNEFLVFKGAGSWTGQATIKQLGIDISPIIKNAASFEEVLDASNNKSMGVLPIWNIHEGEIKKVKFRKDDIIKYCYEHGVFFNGFWPHWIDFVSIGRTGHTETESMKITSVGVARTQCSAYIKELNLEFIDSDSTVDAAIKFIDDHTFNAYLGGAHQVTQDTQIIFRPQVSNPLNFTTFVMLGDASKINFDLAGWDGIKNQCMPKKCGFSIATMPRIIGNLSEDQHEFFGHLSSEANNLDQIPKVIFVSESEYGETIYLVLEYATPNGEIFDLVTQSQEITLRAKAGESSLLYSETLKHHLAEREDTFLEKDFVRFNGEESCFYSCPKLNIFMHGFDSEITEQVFIKTIENHFKAYRNGIPASSPEQKAFLEANIKSFLRPNTFVIEDFIS